MLCRPTILVLLLLAAPLTAQDADIKALWQTGCLWEVGDNPPRVAAARKRLIELGEPALRHALTRLDTTNGLEMRCLNAVFAGWKDKGVDALLPQVGHAAWQARRNVAEILARINDSRATDALLRQANVEENDLARIAQLTPLAKWSITEALPALLTASRAKNDRARGRAPALLASYHGESAANRLVEMLQDPTYHVAGAAQASLVTAHYSARTAAMARLKVELDDAEQDTRLVRRLLAVASTSRADEASPLLSRALRHDDAGVRADAARSLAALKAPHADLVDEDLRRALNTESDPFARVEMQRAWDKMAANGKSE